MAQKNTMAASIQAKKGRLYAVIQHRKDGKTKPVWRSLGLAEDAGKAKITKAFREVVARYESEAAEAEARENLNVDAEIWQGICKGNFLPTKNLIFSFVLTAHISMTDTKNMLTLCGYELDYAIVKDVVLSYLIEQKVFNSAMVEAALKEYKVENLFIK